MWTNNNPTNEFRIHKNTNTKRPKVSFCIRLPVDLEANKMFLWKIMNFYFCFSFYATDLLHSVMRIWFFIAKNYFGMNWIICIESLSIVFGCGGVERIRKQNHFWKSFIFFSLFKNGSVGFIMFFSPLVVIFLSFHQFRKEIPIFIMFSEIFQKICWVITADYESE